MIGITRQGEMAIPPGFVKDLKLIAPEFYPLWDVKNQKWLIVKDIPRWIFRKGYIVEYLVSKDGQYVPLDNRTLLALRRAIYQKCRYSSLHKFLKEIDEEEELKIEKAQQLRQGMQRELMKKAHGFMTKKTFT